MNIYFSKLVACRSNPFIQSIYEFIPNALSLNHSKYLQCENLLKCYFHTLNVSLVNPYMIGFAKLLLMANQWAPRKRASFCWCGTSLKTSVKSPMRLNKWRGNQQIPNITTTMTNILTT